MLVRFKIDSNEVTYRQIPEAFFWAINTMVEQGFAGCTIDDITFGSRAGAVFSEFDIMSSLEGPGVWREIADERRITDLEGTLVTNQFNLMYESDIEKEDVTKEYGTFKKWFGFKTYGQDPNNNYHGTFHMNGGLMDKDLVPKWTAVDGNWNGVNTSTYYGPMFERPSEMRNQWFYINLTQDCFFILRQYSDHLNYFFIDTLTQGHPEDYKSNVPHFPICSGYFSPAAGSNYPANDATNGFRESLTLPINAYTMSRYSQNRPWWYGNTSEYVQIDSSNIRDESGNYGLPLDSDTLPNGLCYDCNDTYTGTEHFKHQRRYKGILQNVLEPLYVGNPFSEREMRRTKTIGNFGFLKPSTYKYTERTAAAQKLCDDNYTKLLTNADGDQYFVWHTNNTGSVKGIHIKAS